MNIYYFLQDHTLLCIAQRDHSFGKIYYTACNNLAQED